MSLYLLDTNMVSLTLSGRSPAARARLEGLAAQDTVSISAVTEGELLFGLAKSPSQLRRRALEQFLGASVVYPWVSADSVASTDRKKEMLRHPLFIHLPTDSPASGGAPKR